MVVTHRFATGNGLRRPWTMVVAEIIQWFLAALVILAFLVNWNYFRDRPFRFDTVASVAFLTWRIALPVVIHSGKRLFAASALLIEGLLWTGFGFYEVGVDVLLADCCFFLVPGALLFFPQSSRWIRRKGGFTVAEWFAGNPLSRNWFDIVDPSEALKLATVNIGKPEYLADRKAIKNAFKAFGLVVNAADGLAVTFPAASAGKMLYQSGVDIHGIAGAFKSLFESSIRVWNEKEVPMEGHKFHFNVGAYRNYLNKFTDGKGEYYIRFTVREIGKDSSVHASTISEVAIYGKNEGARTDSHPENPEDGSKAPFTDNKIALYLSYVNGGWK